MSWQAEKRCEIACRERVDFDDDTRCVYNRQGRQTKPTNSTKRIGLHLRLHQIKRSFSDVRAPHSYHIFCFFFHVHRNQIGSAMTKCRVGDSILLLFFVVRRRRS